MTGGPGIPHALAEEMRTLDTLIAKTFATSAGQQVLAWLKTQYVEGHTAGYVVDSTGQINALASVFDVYQREGQRILVKNLEMRMNRVNKSER